MSLEQPQEMNVENVFRAIQAAAIDSETSYSYSGIKETDNTSFSVTADETHETTHITYDEDSGFRFSSPEKPEFEEFYNTLSDEVEKIMGMKSQEL